MSHTLQHLNLAFAFWRLLGLCCLPFAVFRPGAAIGAGEAFPPLAPCVGSAARLPGLPWPWSVGLPSSQPTSEAAREAQRELCAAIARALPPFVFVGGGAGVCISPDGFILTSQHVVAKQERWVVRLQGTGQLYQALVVGRDFMGDVALLKIESAANLPFARFADISKARVGQWILALGDPYKLGDMDGPPSVSLGSLSALHRYQGDPKSPRPATLLADALQTDAAVNPGNSGGPLLALDGRLLGLTSQIMARFGASTNTRIAYAVPADQLEAFLPLLKCARGGNVYHGTLPSGLALSLEAPLPACGQPPDFPGALIDTVKAGSPAAQAGFLAGDRVVQVQGQRVCGPYRLLGLVQRWPEQTELSFEILRSQPQSQEGTTVVVKVALPRLEWEEKR